MMKKWTAVLLACMMMCTFVSGAMAADKCSHTSMPGYESVYFEGFEGDCADLTFVDPYDRGLTFEELTGFGYSEGGSACDGRWFVFFDSVLDVTDKNPELQSWLYLPVMDIDENSILTFRATAAYEDLPQDSFSVVIFESSDNFETGTELAEYTLDVKHFYDWETFMIDLSQYAGKKVRLGFCHHNSDNGHEMWIDCVHIWEPAQPSLPQTGDNSNLALWIGLMAISLLGAAALSRKAKKAC